MYLIFSQTAILQAYLSFNIYILKDVFLINNTLVSHFPYLANALSYLVPLSQNLGLYNNVIRILTLREFFNIAYYVRCNVVNYVTNLVLSSLINLAQRLYYYNQLDFNDVLNKALNYVANIRVSTAILTSLCTIIIVASFKLLVYAHIILGGGSIVSGLVSAIINPLLSLSSRILTTIPYVSSLVSAVSFYIAPILPFIPNPVHMVELITLGSVVKNMASQTIKYSARLFSTIYSLFDKADQKPLAEVHPNAQIIGEDHPEVVIVINDANQLVAPNNIRIEAAPNLPIANDPAAVQPAVEALPIAAQSNIANRISALFENGHAEAVSAERSINLRAERQVG